MIDPGVMLRLMVGLVCAVYLFLTYVSTRGVTIPRAVLPTIAAVAAVVAIWVLAPGFLAAGEIDLPFRVRQAGLGVAAVGIVARYVGVRRPESRKADNILAGLAAPLVGIGIAAGSANWIVAVAAAILIGTDLVRRVAVSRREDSSQSPPPPDIE